ncbi:hypothetical protein CRYUN_Cryun29cG0103100 [Craigia yunnanensis]
MAPSVSYQRSPLFHHVFQPQTVPETNHPPPRFVQIDLTISFSITYVRHDCVTDHYTIPDIDPLVLSQETLRFDVDVLKNHEQVYQILSPVLTRLEINPNSPRSHYVVDDIIELGLRIKNCTSNMESKVLPLRAELWGILVIHVNDPEASISRVLSESASEFEARNYGMVPAKESSVKKMLEKVSGEVGDEDCMICLEELKVGSDVSRMPCSHTFHANCIEKWLKQSHYCPLCRFEMPT